MDDHQKQYNKCGSNQSINEAVDLEMKLINQFDLKSLLICKRKELKKVRQKERFSPVSDRFILADLSRKTGVANARDNRDRHQIALEAVIEMVAFLGEALDEAEQELYDEVEKAMGSYLPQGSRIDLNRLKLCETERGIAVRAKGIVSRILTYPDGCLKAIIDSELHPFWKDVQESLGLPEIYFSDIAENIIGTTKYAEGVKEFMRKILNERSVAEMVIEKDAELRRANLFTVTALISLKAEGELIG